MDLTDSQRQYIHRSPLPAYLVAADMGITEADVLAVTREEAERHDRGRCGR